MSDPITLQDAVALGVGITSLAGVVVLAAKQIFTADAYAKNTRERVDDNRDSIKTIQEEFKVGKEFTMKFAGEVSEKVKTIERDVERMATRESVEALKQAIVDVRDDVREHGNRMEKRLDEVLDIVKSSKR